MLREEVFELPLDESAHHFVRAYKRYGSTGLEDFVVVYSIIKDGKRVPLVTYYLAHGFAHRDLRYLPPADKRRKKRLEEKPLSALFDLAFEDVLNNWHRYFQDYNLHEAEWK